MATTIADDYAICQQTAEHVFATFAKNFGMRQESMEEWCSHTHQTLQLLLASQYRDEETDFYNEMNSYVNVVENLLDHPDLHLVLTESAKVILSKGIGKIIDRANESIRAQISEAEIAMFCLIAKHGRDAFETNKQPADAFVTEPIFVLATMVRDNYSGYEETLQGLRA